MVNEATLLRRRDQLEQTRVDPPAPLPSWIAPTARGRQHQRARWQQAQEIMTQRQLRNGHKRASKRRPAEKIVLSVTDPEAALSYDKEGVYRPLYNVQILDDLDSPLFLAYDVFA